MLHSIQQYLTISNRVLSFRSYSLTSDLDTRELSCDNLLPSTEHIFSQLSLEKNANFTREPVSIVLVRCETVTKTPRYFPCINWFHLIKVLRPHYFFPFILLPQYQEILLLILVMLITCECQPHQSEVDEGLKKSTNE